MLVLVLTDNEDQTSNFVIDWLLARGVSVKVVVNDLFLVSDYVVSNKGIDFILETEGISLRLSEIMSYWHRRGDLVLFEYLSSKKIAPNKHVYLKNENDAIKTAILDLIYDKHGIGKIWENETNKISNLSYASSVGLKIPSTAISSSKYHLLNRVKNSQFCTKAIKLAWYRDLGKDYSGATRLITLNDVELMTKHSWPSLLQEYQEKKYELRIFYLDGDFYTSAIFSQNDEQTKVDFRNYNQARPNRTPPYQLPKEIEKKLHKLMQKLTIKCGSIDMVVNTKNEFVFLEVNPFGQFQQVSFPCNYYLELKVAEYLTKYDKTEEAVC